MKHYFELNITCQDAIECEVAIAAGINSICPQENSNKERTSHISINHAQGFHQIWIFVYDKNGIHEGNSKGKIVTTKAPNIARATKRPTKTQLENKMREALLKIDSVIIK